MTPSPIISYWNQFTLEQEKIQRRLMELGVKFLVQNKITTITSASALATCMISGRETTLARDAVILVTDRTPRDQVHKELSLAQTNGLLESLRLIADAEPPATIAQAVFAGHLAAREFDETINPDKMPFRVERVTNKSISTPSPS